MRCQYCEGLTLEKLFRIAKEEIEKNSPHHFRYRDEDTPENSVFPQAGYYSHQPSYSWLQQSAELGCDICKVIYSYYKQKRPNLDRFFRRYEAEGNATDIRIAVDRRNYWEPDPEAEMTVLDTFMVQVGYHQECSNKPSIMFDLRIPRDSFLAKESPIRFGKLLVDPSTASEANFEIARGWLKECVEAHTACSYHQYSAPRALPTRLLDIVPSDPSMIPSIRLMNSKIINSTENYVALSHCWGGDILFKLTQANYEALISHIRWQDLPANFQDAITITQRLGLRYLWIDSLCIIQDSQEDWQKESRRMMEVYRDAFVAIAASSSEGSESGILRRQGCWPDNFSEALKFGINMEPGGDSKGFVYEHNIFPCENLTRLLEDGPLSRRGWTLQERVLSPRLLHFGNDMIYWQCREVNIAADGVVSETMSGREIFPLLSRFLQTNGLRSLQQNQDDAQSLYAEWRSIVHVYSRGALTKASDKLPAVSGIAAIFQQMTGASYLAGIFDADINRGLLWEFNIDSTIGSRRPLKSKIFRRPSWSWISTDEEVNYYSFERPRASETCSMKLLNHSTELVNSENPFGQVLSATLEVCGLLRRLLRYQKNMDDDLTMTTAYLGAELLLELDRPGPGQPFYYYPIPMTLENGEVVYVALPKHQRQLTDKNGENSGDPDVLSRNCALLLVMTYVEERYANNEDCYYNIEKSTDIDGDALAIAELPGQPGVYERIGIARVEVEGRLHYQSRASYWTEKTLILV